MVIFIISIHNAIKRYITELPHMEIFRRFLNTKDKEAQKWSKNTLTCCSDKNKKSTKDCFRSIPVINKNEL